MPKENPEVTSSKIAARSTVIVALIGVLGIILTAVLNPLGQRWASQMDVAPISSFVTVEQFPVSLFIYDGRDKNMGGWSRLGISYLNAVPYYEFGYSLPTDQNGYAGISFRFVEEQNLSKYERVEFTLKFDDKESEHTIDFYLMDISNQKSHVRVTATGSAEKQESILLTNFQGISKNAIKEVTFNVDSSLVTGGHSVTVSNIRFSP